MFLSRKTSQNAVSNCKTHRTFPIWLQKWRRSETIGGPGKRYGSDRSHQFFKPVAGIDLKHIFEFHVSESDFGAFQTDFMHFKRFFDPLPSANPIYFYEKLTGAQHPLYFSDPRLLELSIVPDRFYSPKTI